MSARIAWLSASMASLLIGMAHVFLPARVIALRATGLLEPAAAMNVAPPGYAALGRTLLIAELVAAMPWLAAGALCAMLVRGALRRWQDDRRGPNDHPVTDYAGVSLTLRGTVFDHVPAFDGLMLAPMPATCLPRGATELERQAFAALTAAANLPVDPRQPGLTVLQRAQWRYDIAVRQCGAGSLAAIGTVACELGWLLAYTRNSEEAGQWIEVHDAPERLSLPALARLPAYWQLDTTARARVSELVDHACSRQQPVNAAQDVRDALQTLARLREPRDRTVSAAHCPATGTPAIATCTVLSRPSRTNMATCLLLVVLCLSTASLTARAQDAPMSRPLSAPVPAQRVGDVIVDAAVMPVWSVPSVETGGVQRIGEAVSDPGVLARIPPPAPRRRVVPASLEGAFERPEWRAIVPAGQGVPLAAAVVRIAPPGLRPPTFEGIDAALLQTPVSWAAGLDRATALESVLRANRLRAVVGDAGIVLTQAPQSGAAIVDDPAAWRHRAAEFEAAAQEARRAEIATLAREREQLEARRRAAELELKAVEQASEKLQLEHRSRLADTRTNFTDREWKLSPDDSTLRQGLARWARLEGVGFAWEADYDLPVVAELAYSGSLPTVIERLMQKVPPASRLIYSLDRQQGLVVRAAPRS